MYLNKYIYLAIIKWWFKIPRPLEWAIYTTCHPFLSLQAEVGDPVQRVHRWTKSTHLRTYWNQPFGLRVSRVNYFRYSATVTLLKRILYFRQRRAYWMFCKCTRKSRDQWGIKWVIISFSKKYFFWNYSYCNELHLRSRQFCWQSETLIMTEDFIDQGSMMTKEVGIPRK